MKEHIYAILFAIMLPLLLCASCGGKAADSFEEEQASSVAERKRQIQEDKEKERIWQEWKQSVAKYLVNGKYVVPSWDSDYASYNGALYTKDYTTLLTWSNVIDTSFCEEYKMRGDYDEHLLLDASAFHPKLQIIGARAFDWDVWRDCQETFDDIAIPWGVTTLEPGAFAYISETIVFLPDTVVHFSDENLLDERQWSCYYCSYNAAVKEPLNCDYRRTDEEFDIWYTPYGISEDDLDNWISRNGKLYYLHKDDVEWKWSGICHKMATGWQKIDGFFYFFDETGALQQAGLPAGEYDLAGMKLHVDEEGAVSVSGWQQNRIDCFYYDKGELVQDSWQEIDGSRFYFDEAGVLQQTDLPAGDYTFGEVSFTVDGEGRVKAK